MPRSWTFVLAPKWVAGHLLVVCACVAMILLGRWQWRVAHVHHGSVQNYSYAFQWWAFTAFAVVFWLRILRDVRQRETDDVLIAVRDDLQQVQGDVAYRRYVMPQSATRRPESGDPEHAAYNAYLAELARREDPA